MDTITIKFTNLKRYFELRRAGYKTVWSGEGKICLTKPDKKPIKKPKRKKQ